MHVKSNLLTLYITMLLIHNQSGISRLNFPRYGIPRPGAFMEINGKKILTCCYDNEIEMLKITQNEIMVRILYDH
jgi:hypothetical protein